uniref:NADH dehydrogenase [ubiquinone] 1 alpha subcomplex subunit 12 n=1 Tax=Sus scrofa TaxID=9823 RepID=A0A5G2QQP8_PIG
MELVQVLRRGLQQVSGHGGLRGYLRVLFRANDVRVGTLVGEDKYGNKYYEDNKQFFGDEGQLVNFVTIYVALFFFFFFFFCSFVFLGLHLRHMEVPG